MDTGATRTPRDPWHPARRALGDELLASLLGASPSSVRRHATGARTPPSLVSARAHYLAQVIHHLNGTYNEHGVKRWFQRPRTQLNGSTPPRAPPARPRLDARQRSRPRSSAPGARQ